MQLCLNRTGILYLCAGLANAVPYDCSNLYCVFSHPTEPPRGLTRNLEKYLLHPVSKGPNWSL
jgi:hypothetical protein